MPSKKFAQAVGGLIFVNEIFTHLTTPERAAAITSEQTLNGSNGVFAASRVSNWNLWNVLATLVLKQGGRVELTGEAASLFRPVNVVGFISAWERIMAGAHYAKYTNINIATGAATPVGQSAQLPVLVDAVLSRTLLVGILEAQGSLKK